MNIHFTKSFKKTYAKRIERNERLERSFDQRYDLFSENPANEILKDHALSGKLEGYRAFSITGDIRVVYHVLDGIAYFIDIGTHSQVYSN